jgi:SAM-dependent methyltransferase
MQLDLTTGPSSDPTLAYRYRDGLYAPDLLAAALVWFDFFSWIGEREISEDQICAELKVQSRPADVMVTLFCAMGFLERRDSKLRLTSVARDHFVKSSPWFLGPYYASLKDRPITRDYVEILRTGRPANWGGLSDQKEWCKAMEGEAFATQFTAAMDCRGVLLGRAMSAKLNLSGHARLLDVAGGSGIYACSVVASHGHMRATVMDRSPVDQIAKTLVGTRGFADRVDVLAHDMFQEGWPVDYDVHLISNVLHDWDFPEVRVILRNSYRALKPGGLLIIHDAHINREKTGPLPVAAYSALLMHSTQGKCYSIGESEGLLAELGYGDFSFSATAVDRGILTARKPGRL